MKSRILHTIYMCLCVTLLSACIKPDSQLKYYKSPGYIFRYLNIDKIVNYPMYAFNRKALLYIDYTLYTSIETYILKNDQHYYELCVKYGDLKPGGYIIRREYGAFEGSGAIVIAEAIVEIHITSSENWDAEHATGTLLDDIFEVEYDSYMPYIRSNYTGEPRTHFRKTLADIQPGDMYLSTDITFNTESRPTAAQQHTLTVTFVLDTGESIEYDVDVDFSTTEAS